MNGFKVLTVIAVFLAVSTLTEGRAAKREENLDNVVRALQAFVQKRGPENSAPESEEELTAEDVLHHLHVVEDELFLQKMREAQALMDYISLHLMRWLRAHNRAMQMAQANRPDSSANDGNSAVRGLLKRVLFRMQRNLGDNSTASTDATDAPSVESTDAPSAESTDVVSVESTASPETVEQASDETEETIEREEDELEWVGWLTSCWMWELTVHGSAPDFPYWLWETY